MESTDIWSNMLSIGVLQDGGARSDWAAVWGWTDSSDNFQVFPTEALSSSVCSGIQEFKDSDEGFNFFLKLRGLAKWNDMILFDPEQYFCRTVRYSAFLYHLATSPLNVLLYDLPKYQTTSLPSSSIPVSVFCRCDLVSLSCCSLARLSLLIFPPAGS